MLGSCDITAFVATANAEKARAFYKGTLGLTLLSDEPYALVFDANGVTLRVTKVPQATPPPYAVLGWQVDDVAATAKALAAKGVVFERYDALEQDGDGIWEAAPGVKVAWFKDPDGNTLSITGQ